MNKKAFYPVNVRSTTSKKGKIKNTYTKIMFEVVVMDSDKGRCLITPVTGKGTVSVLNKTVKLL